MKERANNKKETHILFEFFEEMTRVQKLKTREITRKFLKSFLMKNIQ